MPKLRIILQFNYPYYLAVILTIIVVFIRINYFPNQSKITPSNIFEGIVTNLDYDGEKYTIYIEAIEEVIGYYQSDNLNINLGDKVKIEGTMYEPSNNTIPNTFNYRKYLSNHQIFYLMKINKIKIVSKNKNIIYLIKNYIINKSNTYKEKGYIKAFILGDKNDLENYLLFQNNGVSHLFAISGMHISLLTAILYFFFKKTKYPNLIIISFLIIFLLISSKSASLLRSIIFYIVFAINNKKNLNIKPLSILLITIVILLIYNPYYIYDYGFLYSVFVTYGLIISIKYYKKNYLYNLLITSIIAFLFSLPITISLNYEINLLSIINNLIIVPLISLIIYPLSLLVFIFKFLEPIFNFMIFILESINRFLSIISLKIIIPKTNILIYIIYYLVLLIAIKTNNFKYIFLNILLIMSLKLLIIINNDINIFFLDVKQGDSALIINKNTVILIDTGGVSNKTISQNTIKLIKSLGYNHINLMILTHGDHDHMQDAIYITNNLKVKSVLLNCGPYNELENKLIKNLQNKKINYNSCLNNYLIGNFKLQFLNTKEYDNENDNSIVIYTILNKYKFLFMGDASITTEKEILSKYNLSHIDVLKVGHHGSKTSSSKIFINEINSKYSIISVGKNNRYGHPNKEVLNNLKNSKIYRTDQDGSIMFKIKNDKLRVETCSP